MFAEKKDAITHLKCREIQAPMVASIIKGFAGELGYAKAVEIAQKVISEDAVLSGKTMAKKYSGNSVAELSRIVKEVWGQDGAIKIEKIKETANELFFDVIHCRYVEIYEKLGIKDLGFTLSCSRDFPFMEGFNPAIKLKRTKTIMEGADYCDFRYTKK